MEGFPGERSVWEEIDFRILEPFSSGRLVGNPQRAGKGTTLSLILFLGSTDQTTTKKKLTSTEVFRKLSKGNQNSSSFLATKSLFGIRYIVRINKMFCT